MAFQALKVNVFKIIIAVPRITEHKWQLFFFFQFISIKVISMLFFPLYIMLLLFLAETDGQVMKPLGPPDESRAC